ncbi:recombinase family protein [Vallitalea guaymasensis]|uniref:recombinase family protein n=1 Tax=Vallitalea guaymasensis TaxID=1185412 RepID=UPI002729704C|nr:recombinase family protein [Vallitalea guaymasensis]
MNIGIYSRKSKITESGESIKNQIELCKEYAYNNFNVKNLYIYEDEGFSGGNTKRPKYQEMLSNAKERKFDVLICYRLDRVSRNVLDFSNILELLTSHNIEFVSIRDHFDTSTPMGRAMMYIASVFAQLERETIAERIKDNMYKLAETGRWLGGITPLGYKSTRIVDESTGKSISILSNVPQESKLVEIIFNKYLEFGSLTKLQLYTLKNNLKTRNNKDFNISSLKNILTNPVYMAADNEAYNYFLENNSLINKELSSQDFNGTHGIMAYNKNNEKKNAPHKNELSRWIISIGVHHPIVTSTNWIKVQSILLSNLHRNYSLGSKTAILTPLIKCKNCRVPLKIISKYEDKHVKHFYYKCRVKESSHNTNCHVKNLKGNLCEEIIFDSIEQYLSVDKLIDKLQNYINTKTDFDKDEGIIKLEKEISETKNAIYQLTLILSSKTSSASKYIIYEIEQMDDKLQSLNKQLKMLTDTTTNDTDKDYNLNYLTNGSIHNLLSNEQKKILINKIIKDILWDGDKLEVELLPVNNL